MLAPFLALDWIGALASLFTFLLVYFLDFALDRALLHVLNNQVELVLGGVVDDFVQFADVGVVELFHDRHLSLHVVERARLHRDCLPAQPCFVHHLHRIDLSVIDIEASEDFRKRP